MKRIILLSLISANVFATELKLSDLDGMHPTYKLEYNTKTEEIKILSKSNSTKYCDKEAKSESTKLRIKRTINNRKTKTKIIVTFRC
ncbi:MAG: hypothetical protein DI631_09635 [Acinetobacter johnsonii]|nr:MAG: hypothetical protein DI631_09635 [Acinetobacter johnsonii]